MIRSMTAFGRKEVREDWGSAVWEVRSVNHRYLDISMRLPEELRALEPEVRARIPGRIRRGKVDCQLRFQPAAGDPDAMSVNHELAAQLARASREVDQILYNPAPISSMDLLRWPGVLEMNRPDTETIGKALLKLLDSVLEEMVAMRRREGEQTAGFIAARLEEVQPLIDGVRARLPELVSAARERLHTRLGELKGEVDEQRLEQEIVLFAQKVDVAEELDRLQTHIAEVQRALKDDKAVGRRLDFLMQEMNREANTLGSKSADSETTRAAVDLKVIIEQIREQVQNVE